MALARVVADEIFEPYRRRVLHRAVRRGLSHNRTEASQGHEGENHMTTDLRAARRLHLDPPDVVPTLVSLGGEVSSGGPQAKPMGPGVNSLQETTLSLGGLPDFSSYAEQSWD